MIRSRGEYGIGQPQLAHSLPMNHIDKKKILCDSSKPEISQKFLLGVIKERLSGTLMNRSKKLGFKYIKNKSSFENNRYLSKLRKRSIDAKQSNQLNSSLGEINEDADSVYITQNTHHHLEKLKQTLQPPPDLIQQKCRKMTSLAQKNLELLKKKKIASDKLSSNSHQITQEIHLYKSKVFITKNQCFSPIRRSHTEIDQKFLLGKIEHKRSVSFNSIPEIHSRRQDDSSSIGKSKASIPNRSLLRNFLTKIKQPVIHPDIFSLIFKQDANNQSTRHSPPKIQPKMLRKQSFSLKISKRGEKSIEKKPKNTGVRTAQLISGSKNFLKFIEGLPNILKQLMGLFMKFFEIGFGVKFTEKQYLKFIERTNSYCERGWQVLGFMFWDYDHDGIISQADLFARFRKINNFDTPQNPLIQTTHEILIIQKNSLIEILYELNEYFSSDFRFQNYLNSEVTIKSPSYLESALLTNFLNPTYTQAESLIRASLNGQKVKSIAKLDNTSSINSDDNQALELFRNVNGGMRRLSAYQRCHIATQHNQHTRQIRQLVQNSRNKLKTRQIQYQKSRKEDGKYNCLLTKSGPGLTYNQYICLRYGLKFKQIILRTLGFIGSI